MSFGVFILFVIILALILRCIFLERVIKLLKQKLKDNWQTMLDYQKKDR